MGISDEMRQLSNEVLDSFKKRVKDNEDLVSDVRLKLEDFRKDHEVVAAEVKSNAERLKKELSEGDAERLRKYDEFMGSLKKNIDDCKQSTLNMLKDFSDARMVMHNELDEFFASENKARRDNEDSRMVQYGLFMNKINDEVKGIVDYTNEMLKRYGDERLDMSKKLGDELNENRHERQEMTQALLADIRKRINEIHVENNDAAEKLKNDLLNGEVERKSVYDAMMDRICKNVDDIRQSTASLLDACSTDRSEAASEWKKMQQEIAQIRTGKGGANNSADADADDVTVGSSVSVEQSGGEEVVVEVLSQPVHETENQEMPATLEDKILKYLERNSYGVKVSDMEEHIQETRMKIGYAAKCLLDAGKVQKIEKLYYPVGK